MKSEIQKVGLLLGSACRPKSHCLRLMAAQLREPEGLTLKRPSRSSSPSNGKRPLKKFKVEANGHEEGEDVAAEDVELEVGPACS
jgi:hypothetical protein